MAKFVKIKNTKTGDTKSVYAPDAKEWCVAGSDWVPATDADRADLERKPPILTPEQLQLQHDNPTPVGDEPPAPAETPSATRGGKKDDSGKKGDGAKKD